MNVVEKAAAIATSAHEGQKRKEGVPYITHPTAVAQMLERRGFSDVVVAAAYVHDVLEDTPYSRGKLIEELGEDVVAIVDVVTENKRLPWDERKQRYIEAVRGGSAEAKAVATADKIHNLGSVLEGYEKDGEGVWQRFTHGKEKAVWFHTEMQKALQDWNHPLVVEYKKLVERLQNLV